MARVSFAGVKHGGIAVLWVLLFAAISIGVIIGLSEVAAGWGGQNWLIVRNGVYGLIGFGVATIVVGRLLNKYTWDGMGWRARTGIAFARGVALGGVMSIVAILLAVVLGARVHITSDGSAWAGVALPLFLGLVLSAVAEELAFRGYPLRRFADGVGVCRPCS